MNRLAEAVRRLSRDLDEVGVRWALVGGVAVSVWCEPRLTRDVDAAVAVANDAEAESLIRSLRSRGYAPIELVEQERASRLATARLSLADEPDGVVVDLLFASSGIEQEIVDSASVIEIFPSARVPVASRHSLIAMKLLARDDRERPQDFDDLRNLVLSASPEDIDNARESVRLIAARGYERRRDLLAALDDFLRELRA